MKGLKVIYRDYESLEKSAKRLREKHYQKYGRSEGSRVPVDEITELTMGYDLVYKDLRSFGALGSANIPKREICICSSIVPEDSPSLEGRYRFTVAHELEELS